MRFALDFVLLVPVEEPVCCHLDVVLANSPRALQVVQNLVFTVETLNHTISRNIVQSDDTIRDSLRFEDPHPTDL